MLADLELIMEVKMMHKARTSKQQLPILGCEPSSISGIVFAKFTVPRHRGQTIVFSKNAVITMRNGVLYLMCRITDLRKYSLLDAKAQVSAS